MNSDLSKVLHPLAGKPLLLHVFSLLSELSVSDVAVVLGSHNRLEVEKVVGASAVFVLQEEPLGTAHAVACARSFLDRLDPNSYLLVLCGDVPLLTTNTIRSFVDSVLLEGGSGGVIVAPIPEGDQHYGRVFFQNQKIGDIVEFRDLMDGQESSFGNTGVMLLRVVDLLAYFDDEGVADNSVLGEFVLTRIARFLHDRSCSLSSFYVDSWDEFIGINSRVQLVDAERVFQERMYRQFLEVGVSFSDPSSVYISSDVKIGRDTFIHPFVWIGNDVKIGERCCIMPFSRIFSGTVIEDGSIVDGGSL